MKARKRTRHLKAKQAEPLTFAAWLLRPTSARDDEFRPYYTGGPVTGRMTSPSPSYAEVPKVGSLANEVWKRVQAKSPWRFVAVDSSKPVTQAGSQVGAFDDLDFSDLEDRAMVTMTEALSDDLKCGTHTVTVANPTATGRTETLRMVIEEALARKALLKGTYAGNCNRSHCLKPGARWFNHSTRRYYCANCAWELNDDPFNRADAKRIWGHDLCTEGPHYE